METILESLAFSGFIAAQFLAVVAVHGARFDNEGNPSSRFTSKRRTRERAQLDRSQHTKSRTGEASERDIGFIHAFPALTSTGTGCERSILVMSGEVSAVGASAWTSWGNSANSSRLFSGAALNAVRSPLLADLIEKVS
jgi:hypothetical protein